MRDDPYANARTYRARPQQLGHDSRFDDPEMVWLGLKAADPGMIYDAATGWKAAAARLSGLADLLRQRVAPALADTWGGEAAAASQAALQKIHATAESLSSTSRRMSDALESAADKLSEAGAGLPDLMDYASDTFTQWEIRKRFLALEAHYAEHTVYDMPQTVSAVLPDVEIGHGDVGRHALPGGAAGIGGGLGGGGVGGFAPGGSAVGGHGIAEFGSGGGIAGGLSHGDRADPSGVGDLGGHQNLGSPPGIGTPSTGDLSTMDGPDSRYSPPRTGTDLAGLASPPVSTRDGGFGAGSHTAGADQGVSGFGAGGLGSGGRGGPGLDSGVPGMSGRGGLGLGSAGAPVENGPGRMPSAGGVGGRAGGSGGGGMVPPMAGAGGDDEEEWERETWLHEDADVWRADDEVSPAVIGQVEEEQPERSERRRRRRS